MKELIINYLDKNYSIALNKYSIGCFDKISNKYITAGEFDEDLTKIFGNNPDVIDIGIEWYKSKKAILTSEIDAFLETCSVVQVSANWLVFDSKNRIVPINKINQFFNNKYNEVFIQLYFSNWVEDKMMDKIVNNL